MNWGKGIIIGMSLFMGFILTMVVIMMRQDVDLVREDYYQHELEFNAQYQAEKNYQLSGKEIALEVEKDTLNLHFPDGFQSGEFTLFLQRPNDENMDFSMKLQAKEHLKIPLTHLAKGHYNCFITGQFNGEEYQMNQEISL